MGIPTRTGTVAPFKSFKHLKNLTLQPKTNDKNYSLKFMLEPPSTYCKCPIFFHKTPLDLGGINPPRFTTMRLLFENGVLSFLSLQGAKAAVGNMLKTRRSKEKKEQQKSFNFERSRGSEDIGSTIPKKILCS